MFIPEATSIPEYRVFVDSFDRQIGDNVAMVAVFKNILLQIAHDRSNASDF